MNIKDPKQHMNGLDSSVDEACAIAKEDAALAVSRLGPSTAATNAKRP